MKLRNKKTGEVKDGVDIIIENLRKNGTTLNAIDLDEIKEEWEDYNEPKDYWYICSTRNYEITRVVIDDGTDFDRVQKDKEIGNYFETPEQAEKAVEKLKAWKRLKDKGFKFKTWGWENKDRNTDYCVWFTLDNKDDTAKDLDLLFGGKDEQRD